MKRFLFILVAAAAVFAGCKKDTSTTVKIGDADLTTINYQLKGIWVYPITNERIIVPSSGAIDSVMYGAGPALQFDGASNVKILQDNATTLQGTYALSTNKGLIYLDINYPDGSSVSYQVMSNDGQTLKLESTVPYTGTVQGTIDPNRVLISDLTLKKQSGADVSGHLIRVLVKSDKAYYSISVSVTHANLPAPNNNPILLNTQLNTEGNYSYEFAATSGDQLNVDILGDYTQTLFYAYDNGVPMAGNVGYDFQEIKTTTGWLVP